MTQVSALQRLSALPTVFRGADLTVRFQWSSKTASQYLYLWKKRGLVDAFGGHSDVYVNLLTSQPDWDAALVMAMPSAVIVGVEALRRAGWTTQIQRVPTVAIRSKHTAYSNQHFVIERRTDRWFDCVGLTRDGAKSILRPAWALADMIKRDGWSVCGLDPDDLYLDDITGDDEADWDAACLKFGLPMQPLAEQAEASR